MIPVVAPAVAVAALAAATFVAPAPSAPASAPAKVSDPAPYVLATCYGRTPRGNGVLRADWMNFPWAPNGRAVRVSADTALKLPNGPWPRIGLGVTQGKRTKLFTGGKHTVYLGVARTKRGTLSVVYAYYKSPKVKDGMWSTCPLATWR